MKGGFSTLKTAVLEIPDVCILNSCSTVGFFEEIVDNGAVVNIFALF